MSEQTKEAAPRRRLRPEQRREEILDSAAEIVFTRGIEALTMEGLAAQAGVNKALPYHYFASRDGVLCSLADREFAKLLQAFTDTANAAEGLEAKMGTLIECWIDLARERRVIEVLESIRSNSPQLHETLRKHETTTAVFMAGLFASERGLDVAEALMLAGSLIGSAQGLVWSWKVTGWSREKMVGLWLKIAMGAIESVAAGRDRP